MISTLERFGVSMEDDLLARFDEVVKERGYASRSEALRDMVRRELIGEEWKDPDAEVIGAVTIVYEHHQHDLANALSEMQHEYHKDIICTTHIHMDADNCLEVIVVRGKSARIRRIADGLISTRGVKHGQLSCTTTGQKL